MTGTTFLGGISFMDAHGDNTDGTIFQFFPDTTGALHFQKVYDFDYIHGDAPNAGLCRDPFGNMYGTTVYGGLGAPPGNGLLFKFVPSGVSGIFNGLQTNTYQSKAGPGPDSLVLTAGSALVAGVQVMGDDQNFQLQPAAKNCISYNFVAYSSGANPNIGTGNYAWLQSCDAPMPNGVIPLPNDLGTSAAIFSGSQPHDAALGNVQFRRSGDYVQVGTNWSGAVVLANGMAAQAIALPDWLPPTASQVVVDVTVAYGAVGIAEIDFPDPYNVAGGGAQGWFQFEGQAPVVPNPLAGQTLRTRLNVDWSTGSARLCAHPTNLAAGANASVTVALMGFTEPLRQVYSSGDHELPYTK